MSQPALPFSSDGGPTYPDGEMSTGSPLLPTPRAEKFGDSTGPDYGNTTQETVLALTSSSGDTPASRSHTPAAGGAPRTPATSGPSSPVLLASFDPDDCCWRTFQATLASELPRYSATLPRSGMTRHGRLYALPMWERPTGGSGGSALLPTATETLSRNQEVKLRNDGSWHGNLNEVLATPTSWLGRREAHSHGDPERWTNPERSNDLSDQIAFLGDLTDPPSSDGSA